MLQPKINEQQKAFYYQQGYWTEQTLRDYWENSVAAYREREYLTDHRGRRFTYGEIDDQASRLASYLMAVCERDVFQEDHGEVSSMIGCSYRQLQRCLSQFCEQGLLCKCEKGVYRINNRKQLQKLGQDIYGGITS